jgi:hypothetical protein
MTSERKEEIITRIMKLMELGNEEKNSNPHEREAASRKAAQLMAEYALDFADLRVDKGKNEPFVTIEVHGSEDHKIDFESSLAGCIARAFDCKIINTNRNGYWQLIFVGTKHDLEIAVYFFKFLRRTMYAMANKNVTPQTINPSYSRRSSTKLALRDARRNYCFGLVTTVGERMKDLYEKREEFIPADSRALMVVKNEGLDNFFHQQFPSIRRGRTATLKGDMNSYYAGKEDGKRVNLSRPISYSNGQSVGQIS